MHDITMELTYGQIHCAACGDYVYDSDLEEVAFDNKMKARVCKRRCESGFGRGRSCFNLGSKAVSVDRMGSQARREGALGE